MIESHHTPSSLEDLPSSVLATRLEQLMTRERHCRAEVLLHLAAFDRRRGYAEYGYESLFTYCKNCLKMSKATAYRRAAVARLISKFPVILDYLRDGRLSTTSACDLRKVLDEDNHRDLLERASQMSEDDIELLAAALDPKAEVADSIRRVSVRAVAVIRGAVEGHAGAGPALASTVDLTASVPPPGSNLEPAPRSACPPETLSSGSAFERTWVALPPKPTELQPINAERYSVHMTVSKEFVEELRQTKDALSHLVPGGNMEDVLRECMRIAREACARRIRGSNRSRALGTVTKLVHDDGSESSTPAAASSMVEPPSEPEVPTTTRDLGPERPPPVDEPCALETNAASSIMKPTCESPVSEVPESRYLPVAVRREVFERDEGCCTFVGANGRRCRSTYQLQFHHKVPFAKGGAPTTDNLTLYCARHNRHQAYEDFGAAHMDRFVGARIHGASPAAPTAQRVFVLKRTTSSA